MIRFAVMEKILVTVFFVTLIVAICLSTILNMPTTALLLLISDFIVAGLVAVFGSLRKRDEEEEKLFK